MIKVNLIERKSPNYVAMRQCSSLRIWTLVCITTVVFLVVYYKIYPQRLASYRESVSVKALTNKKFNIIEFSTNTPSRTDSSRVNSHCPNEMMKIALVACGKRLDEAIVSIKSAITFTSCPLEIYFFLEPDSIAKGNVIVSKFPRSIHKRVNFYLMPINYPVTRDISGEEWKKLFKPCASQRLFFPTILTNIDSLIYVDSDVLFLTPIEKVWNFFHQMNGSQLAAVAPEHEDPSIAWYSRFAKHPYYKPHGINSGVMLMNLTRMRSFGWLEYILPIYKEYRLKLAWGDQDILNILFHFHSDKLFVFDCDWNYRPDHCMYTSICKAAEERGIAILHGSRGVYHNNKQPIFKVIYDSLSNFDLQSSVQLLLQRILSQLLTDQSSNCGKESHIFIKTFEKLQLFMQQLAPFPEPHY